MITVTRNIKRLIVHASATPADMDVGAREIEDWHLQRGWSQIGYHFVIRRSGKIEFGRPLQLMGAHVKGHNGDSIGVCLIGAGADEKDFHPVQFESLKALHRYLQFVFPAITVHGHREFTKLKTCPGFDARKILGVDV
jgi:N-acetylmuramoyl-L-alanine amidase